MLLSTRGIIVNGHFKQTAVKAKDYQREKEMRIPSLKRNYDYGIAI
jgi:hypothetical protein